MTKWLILTLFCQRVDHTALQIHHACAHLRVARAYILGIADIFRHRLLLTTGTCRYYESSSFRA